MNSKIISAHVYLQMCVFSFFINILLIRLIQLNIKFCVQMSESMNCIFCYQYLWAITLTLLPGITLIQSLSVLSTNTLGYKTASVLIGVSCSAEI